MSAVAFGTGPDGRPLLATSGRDATVRLWDLVTRISTVTVPLLDVGFSVVNHPPDIYLAAGKSLVKVTISYQ